jgi:hypothetical protein
LRSSSIRIWILRPSNPISIQFRQGSARSGTAAQLRPQASAPGGRCTSRVAQCGRLHPESGAWRSSSATRRRSEAGDRRTAQCERCPPIPGLPPTPPPAAPSHGLRPSSIRFGFFCSGSYGRGPPCVIKTVLENGYISPKIYRLFVWLVAGGWC